MKNNIVKKNEIYELDFKEYQILKSKILLDSNNFLGEMDGLKVIDDDKASYIHFQEEVSRAFDMPKDYYDENFPSNFMWFDDVFSSLRWLDNGEKYGSYYLVIKNGLKNAKKQDRDYYLKRLRSLINYWTTKAEKVYVGTGKRNFTVYLVSDNIDNDDR